MELQVRGLIIGQVHQPLLVERPHGGDLRLARQFIENHYVLQYFSHGIKDSLLYRLEMA